MNILNDLTAIAKASKDNGVPVAILYGVYGIETDFGRNVKTNSKGYTGPFQFGINEARQYGYPWTNTPNQDQFMQQAQAAAKYLAALKSRWGSWDAAVRHYSGGGYGEAQAVDKSKHGPQGGIDATDIPGVKQVSDAAGAVTSAAGDVAGVVGQFFQLLTSLEFWLRLGEGIAGLVLIAMGLKTLTGVTIPTPVGRI